MDILFEKFKIKEVLKKTEYSTVYLADHVFLEKPIILKTLDLNKSVDNADPQRFQREAQILAKLNHPNIIRVLDYGTFENFAYISFEYFPAQTMREIINIGQLSNEQKRDLLLQALRGLTYAHRNKIVHRDIKPENILVDENFHLKIVDFGLALTDDASNLTDPVSVMGTPAYMSPEQVMGNRVTPVSDLFSLGLVAYEMFNDENPVLGADPGETINNILNFNTATHQECVMKTAEADRGIIMALMNPDPLRRQLPEGWDMEVESIPVEKKPPKINPKLVRIGVSIIAVFFLLYFLVPDIREVKKPVNDILSAEGEALHDPALQGQLTDDDASILTDQEPIFNDPADVPDAQVKIESIPPALIYIDDLQVGISSQSQPVILKPGTHVLTLKSASFPDYQHKISLKGGEYRKISINLSEQSGIVQTYALPWAEVTINGKGYGQTPLQNPIRLNKGSYTIELRNPGYNVFKKSFQITGNDTVVIQHNFSKN